jgi:hypothetical protein
MSRPIEIGGIPLPSDSPVFLSIVGVHVLAGIVATFAGICAMLFKKGPGRHPRAGTIFYWSLVVVSATMATLALMRWAEDKHLFALGVLSFASATLARTALRNRWSRFIIVHIVGMGAAYILMLTAFYVDNGKSLPIWRQLPVATYWLLPSAVGIPLIIRALRARSLRLRHDRLSRGDPP